MSPRILISGAGIAGPTVAHFLARAGIRSTIVERAPQLRTTGQTVDFQEAGKEVLKRMNLEKVVCGSNTQEEGTKFFSEYGKEWADFPASLKVFTNDPEILRGDLVNILYEKTRNDDVQYRFGDSIKSIEEQQDHARVTFESGAVESYDIVIGADGLGSRVRKFAFNDDKSCFKSIGQTVAYFSVSHKPTDRGYSRWTFLPGRRSAWLRPNGHGQTSVYFTITQELPDSIMKMSVAEQKQICAKYFKDTPNQEIQDVLKKMNDTEDFYMQKVAQIKLNSWSKGRVVLVGDAAYCPSLLSGAGVTCGVVGAYVLAGEIAKNPTNHSAAFASYESIMRPYIEETQKIFNPKTVFPDTQYGINFAFSLLAVGAFILKSRIASTLRSWIPEKKNEVAAMKLPNYDTLWR